MSILEFGSEHVDAVAALLGRLPESDRTFIKEELSPEAVAAWPTAHGQRWIEAEPDGRVVGYAALLPLTGWSDHVAELRLVVDPEARGRGVGRRLTQHAVRHAVRAGLVKVVVEVPAAHQQVTDMFLGLGFTGEALLRDHFRDRSGQYQDLLMLAYLADQTFDALTVVGMADVVDEQ